MDFNFKLEAGDEAEEVILDSDESDTEEPGPSGDFRRSPEAAALELLQLEDPAAAQDAPQEEAANPAFPEDGILFQSPSSPEYRVEFFADPSALYIVPRNVYMSMFMDTLGTGLSVQDYTRRLATIMPELGGGHQNEIFLLEGSAEYEFLDTFNVLAQSAPFDPENNVLRRSPGQTTLPSSNLSITQRGFNPEEFFQNSPAGASSARRPAESRVDNRSERRPNIFGIQRDPEVRELYLARPRMRRYINGFYDRNEIIHARSAHVYTSNNDILDPAYATPGPSVASQTSRRLFREVPRPATRETACQPAAYTPREKMTQAGSSECKDADNQTNMAVPIDVVVQTQAVLSRNVVTQVDHETDFPTQESYNWLDCCVPRYVLAAFRWCFGLKRE